MEEINTFVKLQKLLNNLTEETYEETLNFVLDLFHNKWMNDYLLLIIKYTEIRPNKINFYHKIINALVKEKKEVVFQVLIHSQPRFLYFILKQRNFEKDTIKSFTYSTDSMEIAYLSILNHNNRVKQLLNHLSYSRFLELKANNYQKYNEILEYGYEKNSVEYAIKTDDVELLKNLYKENQKYCLDELSQNPLKTSKFSPLALSIFYHSKKCRDFLETKEKYDESCYKMLVVNGELQNVSEEQIQQYKYFALYFHTETSSSFSFTLKETVETMNYKVFLKLIENIEKHKKENNSIDNEFQLQINDALLTAKEMDIITLIVFLISFGNIDTDNFYDNLGRQISFAFEEKPDKSELCLQYSISLEIPIHFSNVSSPIKKIPTKLAIILILVIIVFVVAAFYLYYKYVIPIILQKMRNKRLRRHNIDFNQHANHR